MAGIRKEVWAFCIAVSTGIILVLIYEILLILRMLIKHSSWVIQLQDFVYWLAADFFVFMQMFRTDYGKIRWYFLFGGGLGAFIFGKFLSNINKYLKTKIKVLKNKFKNNNINVSE